MSHARLVVAFFFLLVVNAVHSNDYSQIGLPVSQIFTLKQHQGSDQNWWLTKTDDGLIYVGSGTGLTQWDGEQWHKYATPNNTRIRSISPWLDGGLYVGTIDDIGRFLPDELGRLHYQSLSETWPAEQRQFGEIWSTAATQHGVAFISNQHVYFWNGSQLQVMPNIPGGKHRLFALNGELVFKKADDPTLYKIQISAKGTEFKLLETNLTLPADAYVRNAFYNQAGKLVVVTSKYGIYEQNADLLVSKLATQQLGQDVILYNSIQASDGFYYLVSLYDGLFILNESLELIRHYRQEDNLSANSWYSVLEDKQGNIWLSGIPNVVKFVPPHRYSIYDIGDNSTIIDKLAYVDGKVLAAGDGLFQLKSEEMSLSPAKFTSMVASKDINFDALEYQGYFFYAGSGGVFARPINAPTEDFVNILATNWARGLSIDPITDTVFVSTYAGLFHLSKKEQQWVAEHIAQTEDELEFLAIEDGGVVWAGTPSQEVYRIENAQFVDRPTLVRKFSINDGLPPGNVMPFKLSFGVVIATTDGLMEYRSGRVPALQLIEGLPAKFTSKGQDVFRLHQDKQGRIWYRIGQQTGYIKQDELTVWRDYDAVFKPFADSGFKDFLITDANTLWFAQSSGEVYRANIERSQALPEPGQLAIRQIINLDNNEVLYGGLLAAAQLSKLEQHNNSIRISYSLTNPSIKQATLYRHRLMGSGHNDWSDWSREQQKDYTLLPGGTFNFELQAKDEWGRIYTKQLVFSVLPPWYLSQLAWLIYFVLFLAMLAVSGWLTQRWRTHKLRKQNVLLEQTVTQRTQELAVKVDELEQQKILKERFFTNVSHEFRTPLTLTIAPLQELLREQKALPPTIVYPVTTALNNAKNMLSLVGHILDINRLELGQFPLRITQYNVAELITDVVQRFTTLAYQQQQSLLVSHAEDPLMLYCDRDQLDKCLANLLSNAIKYSGEKSQITLTLLREAAEVGIEVTDNGAGIASDELPHIFERYYQGKTTESVTQPGTGIGLALVKELIELHHGRVTVSSELAQGSCFTLWLKRGRQHFSELELLENIHLEPSHVADAELETLDKPLNTFELPALLNPTDKDDVTTVLVVDDNLELRQFIALRLSGNYRIVQASNGEEGLTKALTLLPDIIISDVMMPKMNGIEMLTELKKHASTNTIPLILLSAKSAKRDAVDGLQHGADDYLTKPFDTSELIARIDGLIKSRKQIRQKLQSEFTLNHGQLTNPDGFINKLRNEVLAHVTDSEFSIDQLAASMAMSRRSLSRKCQEECQQTAGQFITEIRMQTALKLINENQLSLSEIAYGTGYESLSYFSRTFKKFYGKTPSAID
jgi:signal transduction histidine kinase/DNA-binding response OmpR family regulator/ligand-binding sensor domain-containing protein